MRLGQRRIELERLIAAAFASEIASTQYEPRNKYVSARPAWAAVFRIPSRRLAARYSMAS